MPKKSFFTTQPSTTPSTLISPTPSLPLTFNDNLPLPSIFVFDLDYTLWPFWCDTHCTPPLKPSPSRSDKETGHISKMKDRYGEDFGFYTEVPSILYEARKRGITMSVASRTHAPDVAEQLLRGLTVSAPAGEGEQKEPGKGVKGTKPERAANFFFAPQMYPGSKVSHFHKIQAATRKRPGGEEVAFADMIFFDDESRNRNVETELGVTFVLVRDGVTGEEVDKGVREWRRRRGVAQSQKEKGRMRREDVSGWEGDEAYS